MFGGMKNRDCVNDLHFYDLETEQWSPIQCLNDLPTPRYGYPKRDKDWFFWKEENLVSESESCSVSFSIQL